MVSWHDDKLTEISRQDLLRQAKEEELNGIVIERLREMAKEKKLIPSGDKSTLIGRLLRSMMEDSSTKTACL